jgi:predicted nucleic acid-binding protein
VVDTNILAYAVNRDCEEHRAAAFLTVTDPVHRAP